MTRVELVAGMAAAAIVVLLAGGLAHQWLEPARAVAHRDVARSASTRRRRTAALAFTAVGGAVLVGPLPLLAGCLAWVGGRRWHAISHARVRQRAIDTALPDAIDMIVLAVRAGVLPLAAIEMVLPHLPPAVHAGFAELVGRAHDGTRFADALGVLEHSLGAGARPLIDSLAAADRYGLPLAPVLERLATDARRQRRRVADALARQLPVRLSLPLVLCTLPSFVLLAIVPLLLGAFSSLHT